MCFKITGGREVLHAEAVFVSPVGCLISRYIKPNDSGSELSLGISSDDVLKMKSFGALTPVKVVGQKLERSCDYVQWNCMNSSGTGWDEHWAMRHADDNVLLLALCRDILGFMVSTSVLSTSWKMK